MKKGQSLIELLLIIGLLALLLPSILTGWVTSREGVPQQKQRLDASAYLKEVSEAIRSVRDNAGWNALPAASSTTMHYHHLNTSTHSWELLVTSGNSNGYLNTDNNFYEKILISAVTRDSTGAISESGITDPSTKKFEITITWTTPHNSTAKSTFYLTRQEDFQHVETTQADFNGNGKETSSVKIQATSPPALADDGEIVLSQTGGFGDWCTPSLTITALDLPKNGVANAVSAIIGQAAAGTGDNASGVSYANITLTDPPNPTPPAAAIAGTFDGYKTNAVFTEQNYAYLGTDSNSKEIVIVDLTHKDVNNKYSEAGYFNAPGNGNGNAVTTSGDVGYMTAGDKFYTFDLSSHSGSRSIKNPSHIPTLSGTGVKIVIIGTKAYVVTNSTSYQLQIINVQDPTNPSITTSVSVPGLAGRDLFINLPQKRAYLVTAVSTSSGVAEFFLINLDTNTIIGSYDTNSHGDMDPKGVVAVSGAHAIIVGTNGQEYQVLTLSNESSPTWCGGLDINTGINGIATAFTPAQRAYSYIITGDSTTEFKTIEGGPGGSGSGDYVASGTFTSAPFGPMSIDTAFNRFIADISQPHVDVGAGFYGVKLQMAVADPTGGGSCLPSDGANYTYVGTDSTGTGTTHYFTTATTGNTSISGSIPFGNYSPYYKNPSKCFRYQLTLNTNDSTLTPVFKDITVNYSP